MSFRLGMYDWNGTLIDDAHITHACMKEVFRRFAPHATPPTIQQCQEVTGVEFYGLYYKNGIPARITKQQLNAVRIAYYRKCSHRIGLRRGGLQLLKTARENGLKNIIVSGAPDDIAHHLLQCNAIKYVNDINNLVMDKKAAIEENLEEHRVKPNRAFYVDDTFEGIRQARAAGVVTIGFAKGYNSKSRIQEAKPDYVVHSLYEVGAIIEDG